MNEVKNEGRLCPKTEVGRQKAVRAATSRVNKLKATERRLWRAWHSLKKDPSLVSEAKTLEDWWHKAYDAKNAAELDLAIKQDAGNVLWTLFFPRPSGWSRQKVVTRFERTVSEISDFMLDDRDPKTRISYSQPYEQLKEEWKLPDPKLMAERAALVASKSRDFWYHEKEAA